MRRSSNLAAFAVPAWLMLALAQPASAAEGPPADTLQTPADRSSKQTAHPGKLRCKINPEWERSGYETFIEIWGRANPLAGLQSCRKAP